MRDTTGETDLSHRLDSLFSPRSVAIIGASSIFGKWGFNILSRLLRNRDARQVYAVNRKETEILGLPAYPTVHDVPGPVDLAVITVPAQQLAGVIQDCIRKEVKIAVIISSGLAETGDEGARVEKDIVRIAREGGLRFVGPNCLGHFNTYSNIYTVPFMPRVVRGEVALISQSGNSSQSVFNYGMQMGLGFSEFVSSGNEADIRFEDYLEYFARDRKTKLILGYVEGLRDGRRFFELAKEITKKKPIIIMKAGRTDAGSRAARSHSASLAGSDAVLDAAFKQCGVIRAQELGELVDIAVALLGQPLPRGRRVGVLAMGGGPAVMAADALRREGLQLPELTSDTMARLNALLSSRWSHGNPVDPAGDFVSYHCIWPLIEDANTDAVMTIGGIGMTDSFSGWAQIPDDLKADALKFRQAMEDAELENLDKTTHLMEQYGKPLVIATMVTGALREGKIMRRLKNRHMKNYTSPEKAARVLARLADYSEYLAAARNHPRPPQR
ncbi:MAG: CoA-binding protein [Dehalococcoidia bacterium]|nr:CoA-binding protein [Dehalococcoidia bacterium]